MMFQFMMLIDSGKLLCLMEIIRYNYKGRIINEPLNFASSLMRIFSNYHDGNNRGSGI